MKWIAFSLSILPIMTPFLSSFKTKIGLVWFSLICGFFIFVPGLYKSNKHLIFIGLAVFVTCWIFKIYGSVAAKDRAIGVYVSLLNAQKGFIDYGKIENGIM